MGRATRRQRRMRPCFACATRPARSSTRRCLCTPGRDIRNGRASSVTDASRVASRARMARRVGSASAAKVTSSAGLLNLTMWLSLSRVPAVSSRPGLPPHSRWRFLPGMIYTIGHSTRELGEFLGLLAAHRVTQVVDVRRYPASRRHPQFARDTLAMMLEEAGIRYHHEPDLGGRRAARRASAHTPWRRAGFRGHADHPETPQLAGGVAPPPEPPP